MIRMLLLSSLVVSAVTAADVTALHFKQSGFPETASGWTVWSGRPEIAPRTWVEQTVSVGEPGSLAVSGNGNPGAFGGWQRKFSGIEPGAWYRFTASYRHTGITSPNWQIQPRLDWHKANGARAGEVDYAY